MELNNKSEIRWGIIGCGAVTEVKSGPAYQKVANFTLSAVMRRNAELAKDYAERHNVETYYSNADDLIHDKSIDAVYIATPPDTHKLYGLRVAKAGKPCCIEKPLAINFTDSLELSEAFAKAGVPLFVAYYRRTLPRFLKVKSLLDEGKIGTIRNVSWNLSRSVFQADLLDEYNWRTDKHVAPGGYFDDLASHGLDLLTYLLGEFESVRGIALNQQNLYSSFDAVSACWIHKNGITGAGSWNFGSFSKEDTVIISGSEGKITFSVFDDRPVVLFNSAQKTEFDIAHPNPIQLPHVERMREHLLGGKKHPSTGSSAVHTNWVMDQILKNNG